MHAGKSSARLKTDFYPLLLNFQSCWLTLATKDRLVVELYFEASVFFERFSNILFYLINQLHLLSPNDSNFRCTPRETYCVTSTVQSGQSRLIWSCLNCMNFIMMNLTNFVHIKDLQSKLCIFDNGPFFGNKIGAKH